jgi:protein-S-isoprenylcysteine O-methyltransferase Ste14
MKPSDEPSERFNQQVWSSQRNVVFPDTVRNEFRGYDRLLHGPRLKRYQKIGALLLAPIFLLMGVGMVASSIFFPRIAAEEVSSTWFGAAMIPLGLVLACVGLAFAIFGFRLLKRAL